MESSPVQPDEVHQLRLLYRGGMADSGALSLDDYATSLDGWRDLWHVLGGLYLHSFPELRNIKSKSLLRIEVVAENRGSFETVIAFVFLAVASGILGNRADRATLWTFQKMLLWYRAAISGYVSKKSTTTNIEEIAAALEQITRESNIVLQSDDVPPDDDLLFPDRTYDDDLDVDTRLQDPAISKPRALAERIDHSLRMATEPIGRSCERITIVAPDMEGAIEIGPAERSVIKAPLTLPPPKQQWKSARVKFERINRKTGRSLFYFEDEVNAGRGAHYSRITDPVFKKPHNRYTQAFDNDAALDVLVRQTKPEQGHLNLQWEIGGPDANERTLFDPPPKD